MSQVWKIHPQKSDDLIKQLLINRNLESRTEISKFFHPSLKNHVSEIKIPNIDKALSRIDKAIGQGELIVIFGDYDVDGICASAILYKGLRALGGRVLPYIPHREKEGYGLNQTGLEFARDAGASLVITVDNGIVALQAAKFAKEIGLDLIITDHHLPLKQKPHALSIVHSLKMCGAAIAWCLIEKKLGKNLKEALLQFVAIATITDMIPLQGISRAFVYEGLKELNKTDNLGLLSLFRESLITLGKVGTYEISYVIGPKLNAIGRLEHAIDGLRLLCTKDPVKASKLTQLLSETNTQRQKLTTTALEQAKLMIDQKSKIHVLSSSEWLPGIVGLIAGRICEEYGRPTIAIAVGADGLAKGSARSVDDTNIVEVIRSCSDILLDVGGHKGAAGFSIQNDQIEVFKDRMEQAAKDLPEDNLSQLEIEAELPNKKLIKHLVKDLEKFAPFGFGNPQPVLVSRKMKVSNLRSLSDGKHLKFMADGVEAIGFGLGYLKDLVKEGMLVDLAYVLEINRFNDSEILQLKVKDIRFDY